MKELFHAYSMPLDEKIIGKKKPKLWAICSRIFKIPMKSKRFDREDGWKMDEARKWIMSSRKKDTE